jgi:hypothetical protein
LDGRVEECVGLHTFGEKIIGEGWAEVRRKILNNPQNSPKNNLFEDLFRHSEVDSGDSETHRHGQHGDLIILVSVFSK